MVAGTKYENVYSDIQQENQPGTIKNEADENSTLGDEEVQGSVEIMPFVNVC